MPITAQPTVSFTLQWRLAFFLIDPRQWAAERMLLQNTLRAPVDEREECEQGREEIATRFFGSPPCSAVQRSECKPTQQSPPAITTRLPPDVFRPPPVDFRSPAQSPRAAGCTPTTKPMINPYIRQGQYSPPCSDTLPMINLAKFLARRELVTAGLTKFNGTPENFRAWQSSLFNARHGLGSSYSEKLDLLVKWLGKELSEHVKRIHAVYVTNPSAALPLFWDRLQECYGTPEIVENALFKRLDSFPRLSARDNTKLRELSDISLASLTLPLSHASWDKAYSREVTYRPAGKMAQRWLKVQGATQNNFSSFFILCRLCLQPSQSPKRPNFILSSNSQPYSKSERSPFKPSGFKTAIAVHKTDVSATADTGHITASDNDPTRYCPVHKKDHPLEKCRSFRLKHCKNAKLS